LRGSAAMRTSGTVKLLNYTKVNPKESSREPATPRPHRPRGRLARVSGGNNVVAAAHTADDPRSR
jgi:hypothetical protein